MNIIAIDDERSALNILTAAIKETVPSAEVHSFRNPLDALELIKEIKCEVAFLDIEMREMNGIMLAKKLKEIYPKINIIFVTGHSQYANEAFEVHASGYIHKPVTEDKIVREMENLRKPIKWKTTGIYAKTFGDFHLTVNGEEVTFGRGKAKELLAYLIDKKGEIATRKELSAVIFEEDNYSRSRQNYMTKIIKELEDSLKKVGAEKIIKRGINEYSVDLDMFDCDRYNYEKETATAQDINSFKGEYMNQYSWAETTLARLYWKGEYWRRKDPVFRNRDTL